VLQVDTRDGPARSLPHIRSLTPPHPIASRFLVSPIAARIRIVIWLQHPIQHTKYITRQNLTICIQNLTVR
jgi:hypothetical protein